MNDLSHVNRAGEASMVDVSAKPPTARLARAEGRIKMSAEALRAIRDNALAKGDVLAVARVAGIMAAKRTAELIPLCHPLGLTHAALELAPERGERNGVRIEATVETDGKTGVEMEALTAASVAALTIYDMCKAVDRGLVIKDLLLLEKSGGASGDYRRPEASRENVSQFG